jgi:hypothetical protein
MRPSAVQALPSQARGEPDSVRLAPESLLRQRAGQITEKTIAYEM